VSPLDVEPQVAQYQFQDGVLVKAVAGPADLCDAGQAELRVDRR
jgi:hypothetical protein